LASVIVIVSQHVIIKCLRRKVMFVFKVCPSIHYDWEHFLETYKKYVSPRSRVLEVGASDLSSTKDLAELCKELVGVELYSERIPVGSSVPANVSYKVGNCEELSSVVEPESFDLVVLSHVIEHIPDDLRAVNEIYKVLKHRTGVAIINTPNISRITRLVLDSIGGARVFPWQEHQREYSFRTFTQLFEHSRFTDFEVTPVGLGILGWKINVGLNKCPWSLRDYACFFEVTLRK